jgi:hypothetical protein
MFSAVQGVSRARDLSTVAASLATNAAAVGKSVNQPSGQGGGLGEGLIHSGCYHADDLSHD